MMFLMMPSMWCDAVKEIDSNCSTDVIDEHYRKNVSMREGAKVGVLLGDWPTVKERMLWLSLLEDKK